MNSTKKTILILIFLFAASFFLRVWATDFNAELAGDDVDYHFLAKQIVDGKGFTLENGEPTAWRTPMFPAILAAIYYFCDSIAFAKYVFIFFSSLSVVIIYLLAFEIFKKPLVAIVSAISWMISPIGIFLSGILFAESFTAFLVMLAFLITVCCREKKSQIAFFGAIFSGILIGMAILSRGYLIFTILVLPIYLLVSQKSKKLALVCLLFSCFLPSAWAIRNYFVLGSLALSTQTGQVLWQGNNAWARGSWNSEWDLQNSEQKAFLYGKYPQFKELSEVEQSKIFGQEAILEIKSNPLRFLKLAPKKTIIFLSPKSYFGFDPIYLLNLFLAVIGFLSVWRNKDERNTLWLIFFPIICVAAVCIITFGDARFRHPIEFCFMILGSLGLLWIFENAKRFLIKSRE